MAFSNTDSDKLAPFRNQATIISNKKQEVSTKVMEYKSDLDKLYETIEEKKQVLYSLVGGEVLHGEELKEFISKLRKRSILYKQYRSRLQTLTEEVSLLGRTYDILLLNEPSLPTMVQSTKENFELEVIHDLQEAKTKLRSLLQKLDVNKTDAAGTRTQLNTMRSVVQDLIETYNETVKVISFIVIFFSWIIGFGFLLIRCIVFIQFPRDFIVTTNFVLGIRRIDWIFNCENRTHRRIK